MKTIKNKNIWDAFNAPQNIVIVTTNSDINMSGELIMGAGIALQAKKLVPELPRKMGTIANKNNRYGFVSFPKLGIACFQTKYHWKNPSPVELIEFGLTLLDKEVKANPKIVYHCPLLGCGLGGLDWENDVLSLVAKLPNNVLFYDNRTRS